VEGCANLVDHHGSSSHRRDRLPGLRVVRRAFRRAVFAISPVRARRPASLLQRERCSVDQQDGGSGGCNLRDATKCPARSFGRCRATARREAASRVLPSSRGDGEHLLLAAREVPPCWPMRSPRREELHHVVERLTDGLRVLGACTRRGRGSRARSGSKDGAPSGTRQRRARPPIGVERIQRPSCQIDRPRREGQEAPHALQRRGLSRSVGADERDDLALLTSRRDALDGANPAVRDRQVDTTRSDRPRPR